MEEATLVDSFGPIVNITVGSGPGTFERETFAVREKVIRNASSYLARRKNLNGYMLPEHDPDAFKMVINYADKLLSRPNLSSHTLDAVVVEVITRSGVRYQGPLKDHVFDKLLSAFVLIKNLEIAELLAAVIRGVMNYQGRYGDEITMDMVRKIYAVSRPGDELRQWVVFAWSRQKPHAEGDEDARQCLEFINDLSRVPGPEANFVSWS
ncbi:hypothetical protein NA57DRAFT_79291 [Rhizodiscina lignyota]|uniref:Uncharacterized protein n=1 Tax=Rhizodiscina lignyota TaxID=1504668 RepID=A0A9P4I9E5_9PEZI|nr:hypothetical protein NA57DRAFT_79291 [Rhizodiscina lignyota]